MNKPKAGSNVEQFSADMGRLTQQAELLKAMAHPVRLCILRGLLQVGECNVSHMQECLALPQSTVSQNLAKLRSAELITPHRRGTEIFYSISNPLVPELMRLLEP